MIGRRDLWALTTTARLGELGSRGSCWLFVLENSVAHIEAVHAFLHAACTQLILMELQVRSTRDTVRFSCETVHRQKLPLQDKWVPISATVQSTAAGDLDRPCVADVVAERIMGSALECRRTARRSSWFQNGFERVSTA